MRVLTCICPSDGPLFSRIALVVDEFCQFDFCLWGSFFSTYFYLIDGSEGGAAFGVGFGA